MRAALDHFLNTATVDEVLLIPVFAIVAIVIVCVAAMRALTPAERGEDWLDEGNARPRR